VPGHQLGDRLHQQVALHGLDALVQGGLVVAGLDTGPVLAQRPVPVLPDDDEPRLHERIKTVERELLVETVARVVTGLGTETTEDPR